MSFILFITRVISLNLTNFSGTWSNYFKPQLIPNQETSELGERERVREWIGREWQLSEQILNGRLWLYNTRVQQVNLGAALLLLLHSRVFCIQFYWKRILSCPEVWTAKTISTFKKNESWNLQKERQKKNKYPVNVCVHRLQHSTIISVKNDEQKKWIKETEMGKKTLFSLSVDGFLVIQQQRPHRLYVTTIGTSVCLLERHGIYLRFIPYCRSRRRRVGWVVDWHLLFLVACLPACLSDLVAHFKLSTVNLICVIESKFTLDYYVFKIHFI